MTDFAIGLIGEALKSIGFKNKSDGYISDEDLSEQLDQLKETGEYESANFLGFYISDTERMTYKYVVQVLKNGIWENERYYQDPFKYISDGCIKEISQLILTLSSGMDKYSIQVKGFNRLQRRRTILNKQMYVRTTRSLKVDRV